MLGSVLIMLSKSKWCAAAQLLINPKGFQSQTAVLGTFKIN